MATKSRRYDPEEVQGLLEKARNGDINSRNELVTRFEPLLAGLVGVCVTGRVFYRSTYQKTFLKLFSKDGTPLQNVAAKIKSLLCRYDKGEIISAGHMAVLRAIEDTDTNLSSTIVFKFKDIITTMIKDPEFLVGNWEIYSVSLTQDDLEDEIAFNNFLEGLNEQEYIMAESMMNGELTSSTLCEDQMDVFESLKDKLSIYLDLRS